MLLSHQAVLSPVISSIGDPQSSSGCDPKQIGLTLNWVFLPTWGPVSLLSCTPTCATAPKLHLHKNPYFVSEKGSLHRKHLTGHKWSCYSKFIWSQTIRWCQSCRWETRSTRRRNERSKRESKSFWQVFPSHPCKQHLCTCTHMWPNTGPANPSSSTARELMLAEKRLNRG